MNLNDIGSHINVPCNSITFHIEFHSYIETYLQFNMGLFFGLYHKNKKSVRSNYKVDNFQDDIRYHSLHEYKVHFSYDHNIHHKNVVKSED
jgi:hypothetical protein